MTDSNREELLLIGQALAAALLTAVTGWLIYRMPYAEFPTIAFIIAAFGLALNAFCWFGRKSAMFAAALSACGLAFGVFLSLA